MEQKALLKLISLKKKKVQGMKECISSKVKETLGAKVLQINKNMCKKLKCQTFAE